MATGVIRISRDPAGVAMTQGMIPWEAAIDPHTHPADLDLLAQQGDVSVQSAVILNPNTPRNVLLDLAARFPREFLKNPVVPLLLLEDPALYQAFSLATIVRFAAYPECLPVWRQRFLALSREDMSNVLMEWYHHPEKRPHSPKYPIGQALFYNKGAEVLHPGTGTRKALLAGDGWKSMLEVVTRPDVVCYFAQGHTPDYQDGVRFAAHRVKDVLLRLSAQSEAAG